MQEFHALLELLAMLVLDPRTGGPHRAAGHRRGQRLPQLPHPQLADLRRRHLRAGLQDRHRRVAGLGLPDGAAGGLLLGFAIMLPLYVLHAMGAGDVKLMAMVGAFLGLDETLQAVLCAFIVGGVGAIGFALLKGRVGRMLRNARDVLCDLVTLQPGRRAARRPDARRPVHRKASLRRVHQRRNDRLRVEPATGLRLDRHAICHHFFKRGIP